jgi:hypothetical protein
MMPDMKPGGVPVIVATLGTSLGLGDSASCGSPKGCQSRNSTAEHAGEIAAFSSGTSDEKGDNDASDDPRMEELRQQAFDLLGGRFEIYVEVEGDWLVERIRPSKVPPPTFAELRCPAGMAKIPGRVDPPLAPFCISATLVTAAEYRVCVELGRCTEPDATGPQAERYGTYANPDLANYPMNYVDHRQASSYCAFIGGLVPNEDEWLWAYGSAGTSRFPWGSGLSSEIQVCARTDGQAHPPLCPVRSHPKDRTLQGVYDMAGNFGEMARVKNSALPRKLIGKPAAFGILPARGASEEELKLLDISDEDGGAKGLGFTYVLFGGAGAGFRCVLRRSEG